MDLAKLQPKIKFHPQIEKDYISEIKKMLLTEKIDYCFGQNYTKFINEFEVCITDISSITFDFMYLNKKVIIFKASKDTKKYYQNINYKKIIISDDPTFIVEKIKRNPKMSFPKINSLKFYKGDHFLRFKKEIIKLLKNFK